MQQHIRSFLGQFHWCAPMRSLISITSRTVLLPFYHTVSDKRLPHIANLYSLRNTRLFTQDLEFFCRHYQPVSAEELYQIVSGQRSSAKPVFHLTFDDGLKEIYTLVAPILEQKGIPATVFLNSGFVDNTGFFFRYKVSLILERLKTTQDRATLESIATCFRNPNLPEAQLQRQLLALGYHDQPLIEQIGNILDLDFEDYLKQEQPYLTSAQIKDLQHRGFTFGSHSIDHPLFKTLPLEEQKKQVQQSFAYLEEKLGIRERYFSFPFSDDGVSLKFIQWLHSEAACKLSFGISGLKDDVSPFHLHRMPVEGSTKPIAQLVKSEYLYYLLKAPLHKNHIARI